MISYYIISYYIILYDFILFYFYIYIYILLYSILFYNTIFYYIILYYIMLYYIILYYTIYIHLHFSRTIFLDEGDLIAEQSLKFSPIQPAVESGNILDPSSCCFFENYPLVNIEKTMENHH